MSFFPSSSYLRKLIRTSEERLEFLESEELLPKNTVRKDEILKVKSELKTEIVKLKQDLKLTEEPDPVKIKKIPAKNLLSGARYVPFNDWSQERLLLGSKTATSRTKQYGNIGDTFQAGDKSFELTEVSRKNLWDIAQNYYLDEGAKSPEEFIEVWNALHPKGFDPGQVVYFHKFKELTPDTVQLKDLLSKSSLTQEESKKAVSLAQTIYRTQSRNVLTARENIALNTQVRKNLGESYGQLIQEGEVKAAKVAAFRKRQLEEELNILGEIARKTEAPEIPALSPVTDTNFVKNTDDFPFITYEPRPAINYVVKPRQIDVAGFAPQWFSRFDKKEPTFFADWMENQEENLQMVLDEKTGLYSTMISRGKTTKFENRVVNFPEKIDGTLRKERTEKELAALAKKERSVEQKQILEDAKKLFIKVGGKLEEKDFWEYQVNDKGEVFQRLAFFRTPEGALVYAGDNEKIMLESRLSQAVPETGLEDVSFYDSEKIKKRIEERAKAYDKEQYDQDTILTNRGLPVKDADKLRRDTDKFERDFVINFMINHPDQLKPWLDAADPKTIKYLNDVLGGEEVLRRKWLPQIDFKGKLYEVGRTKTSYELPDGLPPETAELLKRDPEKYTLQDIGISPAKIEEVVKGPAPERTKNTVIYVVGHDIPKDPKEYEAFIQRLKTGKEPYFAKLGEEIAEEEAKKPEAGLGMSVSTDILDLLKGKDVPKGIHISSPQEIKNDIQVVRYVQPLKNMASFMPLQDAWKKGFEDITEQAKTAKEKQPDAAIGRVIKLNKAPTRFGAAQEGVLLTDEGKEIQFVAYKKDNPPMLEYNNRYTFKNPGETIEGSKTISQITQENVEKTNFPSQQITTRGIVYDVVDVNDPTGTAQYGHMISPADGKLVKFTTFSRDNPPVLKKNEAYIIYNAWLQGFQTNTGKIELNLNIKPENIYPERAAISKEQKALAEELRADTYRSEVHPTEYKPFKGQPPKPQKISPVSDPVVATTVENGEIIVITSSGKRIPGKEYAKQYASLKPKKAGVAFDDETLNKIEDETPLDEDQLFMLGLLPIGALGMTPEEFPVEKTKKDLRKTAEDARTGLTDEELKEQSRLAVQASMQQTAAEAYDLIDNPIHVIEKVGGELIDSALNLYRATPLKTIFTVKEAREYLETLSPEDQKYAQQHPYETGLKFAGIHMLGDVSTILKPLSNTAYAVGGIASGEGPLEGILKERIVSEELGIVDEDTSFWEWKKPERAAAGFLTDVITDPASWIGVGVTKKLSMLKDLSMEKLWQSTVKEVPGFLKDDSAGFRFIKNEPVGSHSISIQPQRILSPKDILEGKSYGYLDPRSDFGDIVSTHGDFAVVVKDTDGHRAIMNAADYLELQKDPFFAERVRAVWIKPDYTPVVRPETTPGFMQDLHPDNFRTEGDGLASLTDGSVDEALHNLEDITFRTEAAVTPVQKKKFEDMLLDKNIQSLLKERGIREVIIEPPYKHPLSGQASIDTDSGIIKFNADATDPIGYTLHELGHKAFKDLPVEEQNKLIERIKNAGVPRASGYLKLEDYEEAVAETLYKEGSVFPEYASKVKGTKIPAFVQYEPIEPPPELQTFPLEEYLQRTRKGSASGTALDSKASEEVEEFKRTFKGPDYAKEDILNRYEMAERLGVTQEIEDLSAQRLTAKEAAKKIVSSGKVKASTGGQDSAVSIAEGMVRGVRSVKNIPSMDDKEVFEEWVKAYHSRAEPTAKSMDTQAAPKIISTGEAPGPSTTLAKPVDTEKIEAAKTPFPEIDVSKTTINMVDVDPQQLTSPLDDVQTVGINRQKQIADEDEVIKRTRFNWNKAGLTALAGATGAAAGYQMLSGKQQDKTTVSQIPLIAPNNTTAPITPFYAPASQEQEGSSEQAQPGQTAMEGVLGILDILNIPNYAVGSLISGKSFWDKTSISESLGITDKDTSLFSLRGAAGLAADIFLDPTTYLTLGSSAAVKIGAAGGKRIALSGRGVKALAQLKKTHGVQAESMLATAMLNDPKLYSKFHAVEGIGVRSWGPVIGGKFEYELVSKETLKGIAAAPGSINDDILRRMVTSGNIPLEKAAVAIKGVEISAAQKAARVRDVAGDALVPFYRIKKLARPASLAPGEPEYADKFLRFKKTVRLDVQKYVKVAEDLAKRSKAELGDDYNEILMKYLETPVLPREGLSQETQNILTTIEDYHKAFAIEEKQRGILEKNIPGYLRHALTKEAREYLGKGKKASTEVYDLKNFAGFAEGRSYKGTIENINANYRAAEGVDFDLFEPDVFAAFGIRASEHVKAVEEYDFLEWVARNYGKDVAAITDPGFKYTSLSQLNARLPPGTDTGLLQDAKDILNQVDPLKSYTARSGAVFTAEDILKDVEAFNLISTKAAKLTRKEELAYTAIYLGKRMEDMTPRDAANYARTNLMRTQVPEEIAEHLEPEIFPKETASWLKTYDKALTAWKFGQTVPWPAYHAQNIAGGLFNTMLLGEMRMRAAGESLSMLTGKSSGKIHKTAIGDEYTTEQVLKAAEELGVTGQPGLMDIPKEIKDVGEYIKYRTSDKTIDKIGRGWDKVSPTTVARTEEDWMRLSIFYDRLMKGDTPEDAASFVTKFLFEYMPEGKTGFERDYMRRMIPFYTYLRGNVPLQLESLVTQPGKYAAFAKANQAAMGNQTAPDWTGNWDLTAPAGDGYFYGLRTPASDLDKFSQYTDALSSPAQTEEDLYKKLKALEMFTPAVKGPAEAATGWNFFAQKPYEPGSFANYSYDPKTNAALSNIIGKPYNTAVGVEDVQQYNGTEGYKQKVEDFTVKQTTSAGRYKTQTRKDLEDQFNAALKRKNDFTWQQRFEGWKRDEMASPLSGIPDELQGGHIQAVAEGGLPIMENFLTMTKEENAEQTASQLFRLGLPEKEFKQEEFWEEMKVKEGTKLAESTLSTTKKLEKEGKWVNDAVREKLEYDAKKAINIQLYSRELAKIRMQLDWAQRRLRNEQAIMDRKRKDPDFKGDKWSERQIQALEWFIPRYQAQYAAIERLREQERVKEFELPEQIIQGEDYDKGMLGKERTVNILGKGPDLADPEQIKNMVKYDQIALERSVILEDVAIIDLPKYVPKHIRDSIKKPSGPEWKEKQDKATWYARVIWGDETEVPEKPATLETQNEGWAISPFMPVASVAMINMGTGRKSPVQGLNKSLKTPTSPLERPATGESPGWNLTLPSVSDVVGLFLPHPAVAEPVSEEAVQQKSDMAKEEFLESDEFITAVQSIVTDYLDRGIER